MTSVIMWWRERLVARFPVSDAFKQEPFNYKSRDGAALELWPARVARQALWKDYGLWADGQLKAAWSEMTTEERVAQVPNELHFFSTLAPYLYVDNKRRMVKNYSVKTFVLFEGNQVEVRKRRYFVRLAPWKDHMEAFLRQTGTRSL